MNASSYRARRSALLAGDDRGPGRGTSARSPYLELHRERLLERLAAHRRTTAMHEEASAFAAGAEEKDIRQDTHERHDQRRVRRLEGRSRWSRRPSKVVEDERTNERSLALVIVWIGMVIVRAHVRPPPSPMKRHRCVAEQDGTGTGEKQWPVTGSEGGATVARIEQVDPSTATDEPASFWTR
jgi:hypothetical protein